MATINTNIMAYQAETALKATNRKMTTAMERLATGYKINRSLTPIQKSLGVNILNVNVETGECEYV